MEYSHWDDSVETDDDSRSIIFILPIVNTCSLVGGGVTSFFGHLKTAKITALSK